MRLQGEDRKLCRGLKFSTEQLVALANNGACELKKKNDNYDIAVAVAWDRPFLSPTSNWRFYGCYYA